MLVLDANILIRAVLGSRVLGLVRKYGGPMEFMAPDVAFQEAREHLPGILAARKIPVAPAMETLDLLMGLVQTVEAETYASFEAVARERIEKRNEDDWPVLAAAVAWAARSGPKTRTSSDVAWPLGQQIAWSCTWQRLRSGNNDGRRILSARA